MSEYLQHVEALLSPDLIIVGGGISKESEKWVPLLTGIRAKVVPAALQNDAGIVGAAMAAGGHGGRRVAGARVAGTGDGPSRRQAGQNLIHDLPETPTAELRAACESLKPKVRRMIDEGTSELPVMKARVSLKSRGWS